MVISVITVLHFFHFNARYPYGVARRSAQRSLSRPLSFSFWSSPAPTGQEPHHFPAPKNTRHRRPQDFERRRDRHRTSHQGLAEPWRHHAWRPYETILPPWHHFVVLPVPWHT